MTPYSHQLLQAEHGIKSLSTILTKHLTNLGQLCSQYKPLATFAYNTFNTSNLANYSPYQLVFHRKPNLCLDLETTLILRYWEHLKISIRLQYLHKLLQDFRSKRLVMIKKINISSNIIVKL